MAHIPVLYEKTLELLDIPARGVFLDMTLGGFGHGRGICELLGEGGVYIGLDLDSQAIERAQSLSEGLKCKTHFIKANFHDFADVLEDLGIKTIDGCLADLGVSSFQIDEAERGFSFSQNGPLDMRMDNTGGISAADIVNDYSEERLKKLLYEYGEEKYAPLIAKAIAKQRKIAPIETTGDLARVIEGAVPPSYRYRGRNACAKTFQALRIEVNGELEGLKETLTGLCDYLNTGARMAVISFHSLEDRIVKKTFAELSKTEDCSLDLPALSDAIKPKLKLIIRSALKPSQEEIEINVRSRSAKLRVVQKI